MSAVFTVQKLFYEEKLEVFSNLHKALRICFKMQPTVLNKKPKGHQDENCPFYLKLQL